jgi:hypothetical protein
MEKITIELSEKELLLLNQVVPAIIDRYDTLVRKATTLKEKKLRDKHITDSIDILKSVESKVSNRLALLWEIEAFLGD